MKTTLITLLALLTMAALLLPVKLASSEVNKDLREISISYRIGNQKNNNFNKENEEPVLNESEKTINSIDDNLSMEDWMSDLSEWETVK